MRKKYNPLKMIGSYLGALIGYAFHISGLSLFPTCIVFESGRIYGEPEICMFLATHLNFSQYLQFLPNILVGFLVGWAIHLGIRGRV